MDVPRWMASFKPLDRHVSHLRMALICSPVQRRALVPGLQIPFDATPSVSSVVVTSALTCHETTSKQLI